MLILTYATGVYTNSIKQNSCNRLMKFIITSCNQKGQSFATLSKEFREHAVNLMVKAIEEGYIYIGSADSFNDLCNAIITNRECEGL